MKMPGRIVPGVLLAAVICILGGCASELPTASVVSLCNVGMVADYPEDNEWMHGKALLYIFRGEDLQKEILRYQFIRNKTASQSCYVRFDLGPKTFIAFMIPPDAYRLGCATEGVEKNIEFQARPGEMIFVRAANEAVRLSSKEGLEKNFGQLSDAANINDDEVVLAKDEVPLSAWTIPISAVYYPAKTIGYIVIAPFWLLYQYHISTRNSPRSAPNNLDYWADQQQIKWQLEQIRVQQFMQQNNNYR